MLKYIDTVNVNKVYFIYNYSVIKTLVLAVKFCSQNMYVVVLLGEGGGGGGGGGWWQLVWPPQATQYKRQQKE